MHPVLFDLGFIRIYSYGFCLAAAFIVGLTVTYFRAKRYGENPANVLDLGLYTLIGGIIGARFLYIIYYYEYFIKHPLEIVMIQRGGLVFHGAIIFGILIALAFFVKRKLSILKYADIFAPAFPIAQAVGRIGCFLNGCCFGRPTYADWGVVFPFNSAAGRANIFRLNLHPTQIYSSLFLVLLFVFLTIYDKYKKYNSQTFLLYGSIYSFFRYCIEFYRIDDPKWILHRFTTGQAMSLFLLILCLIGMVIERRYQKKHHIAVVRPN